MIKSFKQCVMWPWRCFSICIMSCKHKMYLVMINTFVSLLEAERSVITFLYQHLDSDWSSLSCKCLHVCLFVCAGEYTVCGNKNILELESALFARLYGNSWTHLKSAYRHNQNTCGNKYNWDEIHEWINITKYNSLGVYYRYCIGY